MSIPDTKKRNDFEENARAAEMALTTEQIRRIEEAAPVGATAGPRYPEGAMRGVNV